MKYKGGYLSLGLWIELFVEQTCFILSRIFQTFTNREKLKTFFFSIKTRLEGFETNPATNPTTKPATIPTINPTTRHTMNVIKNPYNEPFVAYPITKPKTNPRRNHIIRFDLINFEQNVSI